MISNIIHLTARADVAGSNILAYIKLTIPAGYSLVSAPFSNPADDSLASALPGGLPDGFEAISGSGPTAQSSVYSNPGWSNPSLPFPPGGGLMMVNPATDAVTVTMAGYPIPAPGQVYVPAGRSLRGCYLPIGGPISQALGFPPLPGVKLLSVNSTGTEILLATCDGAQWLPVEPRLEVGQAVTIDSPQSFIWRQGPSAGMHPPRHPVRIKQVTQGISVHEGDTFTLVVEAGAESSLKYQWQQNGENVPGARAASYQVAFATAADAGLYWVRASSDDATAWSALIPVRVVPIEVPLLTGQWDPGTGYTLRATASSGGDWVFEGSPNLSDWSLVSRQPNDFGSAEVTVPADQPARFFRVRRE
ncbi:MAG TPA: immunoglobulin domain-containing protein [Candidatus Limnocylindria bacterium]|nr:immunoglobulin domain-containing protein [Candidatus Limnocylindria bacterium]